MNQTIVTNRQGNAKEVKNFLSKKFPQKKKNRRLIVETINS